MGGVVLYMDTILVPISLFITIGYHAYLWHNLKNNPRLTTIGMNFLRRRLIFQDIQPVSPLRVFLIPLIYIERKEKIDLFIYVW